MRERLIPDAVEYILEKKLGEGVSSEVYLATRMEPKSGIGQTIALKWFKSTDLSENWKYELEQMSKFRSDYCVRVLGWDWIQERPSILLEYIRGVDLDRLHIGASLDIDEINFICDQIQRGLLDLNKDGLYHGDLSPSNILVDVKGKVRLIDFGLKDVAQNKLFVSPEFAHPDTLSGFEPNLGTDLYSLGCVREFLLGYEDKYSNLLKDKGAPVSFPYNQVLASLGEKVKSRCADLKVKAVQRTKVFSTFVKPADQSINFFGVIGLCLLVFFLSFSTPRINFFSYGFLSLRSPHWAEIFWQGKKVGDSPILAWTTPAGQYKLEYRNHRGLFEEQVSVTAGSFRVIQLGEQRD